MILACPGKPPSSRRRFDSAKPRSAATGVVDELEERPLWATVASGNAASGRGLEKCGFALEGEIEESGEPVLLFRLAA